MARELKENVRPSGILLARFKVINKDKRTCHTLDYRIEIDHEGDAGEKYRDAAINDASPIEVRVHVTLDADVFDALDRCQEALRARGYEIVPGFSWTEIH